jgi:5-formyltetrahydrofolate cyclo-ligase
MSQASSLGSAAPAKRELRRRVIARRDAIPPARRRALSEAICTRVAESPEFENARFVLLFASFGSEVDTSGLVSAALEAGKRVALPRVDPSSRELELREITAVETDLQPGLWDIPEPILERCPETDLAEVDFILVPGVAFDRSRRRLGYGGGYYDRILSQVTGSVPCIAICFEEQLVAEIPADDHDLRVPILMTENERIE